MALYYTSMVPVVAISHDPRWLRLPALLAVAGATWLLWAIGKAIGDKIFAGTATAIFVLSWFTIRYATEARGFGLSSLLVTLSWLALIKMVTDSSSSRRWWVLWSVAIILAPLAHGMAALQFFVQGVALAAAPQRRVGLRRFAVTAVPFAAVMATLFSFGAAEVGTWASKLHRGQIASMYQALIGPVNFAGVILGAMFAAGLFITLRAAWTSQGIERFLRVVPALWALGLPTLIVGISVVKPYAVPRYAFTALPGIALVLATALRSIDRTALRRLLCFIVAVAMLSGHTDAAMTSGEEWDQVVQVVTTGARNGDALLATDTGARAAFDVAWEAEQSDHTMIALLPGGKVGEVQRFYPKDRTADVVLAELLSAKYRRVWLVGRGQSGAGIEMMRNLGIESRYEIVATKDFGSAYVMELRIRALS